ncbi:chitin deacetylase [Linnemannia zychae]|nr:chitin deacetylase [Linnemannia zychae]
MQVDIPSGTTSGQCIAVNGKRRASINKSDHFNQSGDDLPISDIKRAGSIHKKMANKRSRDRLNQAPSTSSVPQIPHQLPTLVPYAFTPLGSSDHHSHASSASSSSSVGPNATVFLGSPPRPSGIYHSSYNLQTSTIDLSMVKESAIISNEYTRLQTSQSQQTRVTSPQHHTTQTSPVHPSSYSTNISIALSSNAHADTLENVHSVLSGGALEDSTIPSVRNPDPFHDIPGYELNNRSPSQGYSSNTTSSPEKEHLYLQDLGTQSEDEHTSSLTSSSEEFLTISRVRVPRTRARSRTLPTLGDLKDLAMEPSGQSQAIITTPNQAVIWQEAPAQLSSSPIIATAVPEVPISAKVEKPGSRSQSPSHEKDIEDFIDNSSMSDRESEVEEVAVKNTLKNSSSSPSTAAPIAISGVTSTRPARHPCPRCSKRFTRPFNLRSHILAHDNERPYASSPLLAAASVNWGDFLTSCQTPGQIALTYSEGPSEATMEMLQTLKDAQARVTFFANVTWLQYMQYAAVTRHAYLDGHLIAMTYRLPSDTTNGMTTDEVKEDIGRASRTIQDLIGVYPKYMKVHESSIKDPRLLDIVRSMGYTLVGFNLDEYDYKFNTFDKAGQIAEVYNSVFSKQQDAYGRKSSYIVARYDVPSTGAAAALPKVINTINAYGYDMVRLVGCASDKTPYKKDPIKDNGYVSDAKSFGAQEYKHGQVNVQVNFSPSAGKGIAGNGGFSKGTTGSEKASDATKLTTIFATLMITPAILMFLLF